MFNLAVRFALGLCGIAAASTAHAQPYSEQADPHAGRPSRGPSDVPARIIGQRLRSTWASRWVVENKTGAAGMIALNEMLAQPRDGHTLLLCSYIDPTNTHLFKKVSYSWKTLRP